MNQRRIQYDDRFFTRRRRRLVAVVFLLAAFIIAAAAEGGKPKMLRLTSSAFVAGEKIPTRYTCDGEDISPPLKWDKAPPGTASLALICDDPDAPAGTWLHWVIYNIQPDKQSLPERISQAPALIANEFQTRNDFGNYGYNGPCPPGGKAHRYFFKLYALDFMPKPTQDMTKAELEKIMEGHILAEGSLMGTYQRK